MSNERNSGPSPARRRTRAPYSSALNVTSSSHGITSNPSSSRHRHVIRAVQRAAHAGEQRPARVEKTLLERPPKRRAVVVALPHVAIPDVRMRVEENEAERAVHRGMRPELAEDDRVVSAETEGPRTRADDGLETLRDLRHRLLCVAGGDLDVTEIGDGEPAEDLSVLDGVVRPQHHRRRSHGLRAEPRAGTVRRPRVERNPEHGDVDAVGAVDERAPREGPHARVARRGEGVRRLVAWGVLSRHAATVPGREIDARTRRRAPATSRMA